MQVPLQVLERLHQAGLFADRHQPELRPTELPRSEVAHPAETDLWQPIPINLRPAAAPVYIGRWLVMMIIIIID